MKGVLFAVAFILMIFQGFPGLGTENGISPESLFQQANEYYAQQNYPEAISLYEQLIDAGYGTFEVYYNLGNAYYKTNQIGKAILYYEKAKKLNPRDEDLLFNLKLLDLRVADKIEPAPEFFIITWWKHLTAMLSADQWAYLATAMIWIAFFLFAGFIFTRTPWLKRTTFFSGLFALLLAAFFTGFAVYVNNVQTKSQYAIVLAPNAYVKSAPDNQSTDLFILHEGTKARVLETVGDWSKIKLADGKTGWIPNNNIANI